MLVLLCAGEAGGAAAVRAGDRDRARPHGDPGPRRRPRRGAAAPRAADGGRDLGPRRGRWRPATCCFSRAFALLSEAGDARVGRCCSPTPRWRWPAASSPSARTPSTSAITEERYLDRCRLKTAALFECAVSLGPTTTRSCARFGAEVGLAFQLLDDVLDVTGPPERTGKARGTDLLDGTVTLPLIVAAERDPGLREIDLPRPRPGGRRGGLRPDRGDRRARRRCGRGRSTWSPTASARLGRTGFDAEQRRLLELVADGVVQRYS